MKITIEITPDEAAALIAMQAEFESNRLEVGLAPPRRPMNLGGMIRVPISRNAKWYREFCDRYASSRRRNHRKFDTRIKRANTSRVLSALCDGRQTASKYAEDFLREARARVRTNPDEYRRATETEILYEAEICDEEPF